MENLTDKELEELIHKVIKTYLANKVEKQEPVLSPVIKQILAEGLLIRN